VAFFQGFRAPQREGTGTQSVILACRVEYDDTTGIEPPGDVMWQGNVL
jgi:hypothetical protein